MKTNVEKARAAWAEAVPDWVMVLAEACDRDTQGVVADRIEYSKGVVSTILNNRYRGDLGAVQKAVEGALLNATVQCPVAGEIGLQQCQFWQRQPFKAVNSQRVQLYKACRSGCPHSRHTGGKS